jgi:hypothetical protein
MTTGLLFDPINPAPVADTSRAAWDRILPTLAKRELAVFFALCDMTELLLDVTGGELTEYMRRQGLARDVNGVRPRLVGLRKKGYIERRPERRCLAYGTPAHPYVPCVPREAIRNTR